MALEGTHGFDLEAKNDSKTGQNRAKTGFYSSKTAKCAGFAMNAQFGLEKDAVISCESLLFDHLDGKFGLSTAFRGVEHLEKKYTAQQTVKRDTRGGELVAGLTAVGSTSRESTN